MPPAVHTRHATTVSLPSGDGAPPLPLPDRHVRLSPFDAHWAALPPVCHVFLFPAPSPPLPFQDVARAFRSSLATVLPAFHPLAGELAYSPESRAAVSIVLAVDARVAFVEAETELEFARLLEEGPEHEQDVVDALRQLVPDIRRDELPAPVMAAQVTEFVGDGGGVAVGVAVHHAAVDGRGLWRFIEMWAAAATAGVLVQQGRVAGEPAPPVHDRSLVRFDGDEEVVAVFLRQLTPDLPRVSHLSKVVATQDPSRECRPMLSRRTFTLPASTVRRQKQRLAAATGASSRTPPSTFAALAAHAWVSLARASGFTDGAPVFAAFLADCRAHVSPPAPDGYAGNCVAPVMISLSGEELAGEDGPARAFLAIREAVEEVRRDPLADCGRWIAKFDDIPPGRTVVLVGSPRFPAYAVDFGFGTPARVEKTSLNHDGEISLLAGREAGSVQASVVISSDKMPAFREMFGLDV
ncbi:unnamed protein product [Urochloa decumbens]|uniref:Uncharacterized protein n=1 Tax=Urochloa decumbens TaxID=240449 RepID=A0ABC8YE60_9POAL